ncbi:SDR family NAD(P)-dependent oxidoreductase [Labrys wisconsinensis]|uniref:NAD(P)-dependent dehydrogenase (Short-subunit alcohol dehydrogenase family) n=1 Tax=Labrys wisconsinensis TaxID=425677 RepID=A0ABU0JBP4_9HYPH|nr:SDR family NAD(P)-dependent oxidoreductase [Labrys wisconsinensis]MDQ0471701.1 NAD(P)-dependent dehydrogenase (short-subunit alcohol dehydrogenase family) [Labrys wisconsinensis]
MPSSLRGRIILVTGASRGIGRAAALALAAEGATVVGVARTLAAMDGLQDAAKAVGGDLFAAAVDMADAPRIHELADLVGTRYGRLDGLFGNAGLLGPKAPIGEMSGRDWDYAISVNLTANWHLLHEFDPLLRRSDAGRALFVTSGVAWKRHAGWTPYAATKAGLEAMVGVYANEVADTPVRANLISPGPIRTELRVEAWPDEDPATVPTPEELAPAIVMLLSPGFTENGVIYDYREHRVTRHQPPA